MFEIIRRLAELREPSVENLIRWFDILLVTFLLYRLLALIKGTRAWRILGGVVGFVILLNVSDYLKLTTLHWLLDKATQLLPVALVILLLPELRQALEGFARLGLWPDRLPGATTQSDAKTVEEVVAAVAEMAAARCGAIIVIERGTKLDDVASNGVQLNAQVSAPLISAIFYHGNPLHDGAVVIRNDTIIAAACRLPLSENNRLDHQLHMRHRAACGITEITDAVGVVVSEERGTISWVVDGVVRRLSSHAELREIMNEEVRGVHGDQPRGRRVRRRQTAGDKVESGR